MVKLIAFILLVLILGLVGVFGVEGDSPSFASSDCVTQKEDI